MMFSNTKRPINKLPQRYLKPELQSKAFKKECKNECLNKRQSGSAYCKECSDKFNKPKND